MSQLLYLAWRYLAYHRVKVAVLVTSVTLIFYVPVGLRVIVDQSSRQLTARAKVTPLLIGAKGSQLELALSALYFGTEPPEPIPHSEVARIEESGLALPIPLHTRFRSRSMPIVGTTLDYFPFRDLTLREGRQIAVLGECVLGARVAKKLGLGPGDSVISSPETVFDLAGNYPLKMSVVGVLGFSDGPDDDAIFVDLKTAWVMEGLGHGHQDLSRPEASAGVLTREGSSVTANASVVQYNEITEQNRKSFHFHGSLSGYPVSAVIVVPPDQKSAALLRGRYTSPDERVQVVQPETVMDQLLDTVVTVQRFVVTGAVIVGFATLGTVTLVFLLSLRLRARERETLHKIGGSRFGIATLMASEVVFVLGSATLLAGLLTLMTREFGAVAIRALVRM